MRKREQDAHEKKLRAGFVRLMFAARNLISGLRHCRIGEPAVYCSVCDVCQVESGDSWAGGPHASACPVGQVAGVLDELMRTVTVAELGRELEGEPAELGAVLSWVAAGSAPGAPGEPDGAEVGRGGAGGARARQAGPPGRKPPARADGSGPEAVAIEPNWGRMVDFGEPWKVGEIDGGVTVLDRTGEVMFFAMGGEGPRLLVRRVIGAVNLCAGAPTNALEFAYSEISASSPQWALLALNISNLTRAHVAMVRDYIDDVVKAAARHDPAHGFGRPQ